MLHKMNLQQEPFNLIKTGYKTIEMRLNDEKRQKINKNDEILFICDDQQVLTKVKEIYHFDSFKELYKSLKHKDLGYLENQTVSYNDMDKYYSIDKQKKYGVLGIEIELIKQ